MNHVAGGHRGDVGTEIAPETVDDPVLAGGQEFSPDDAAQLLKLAAFAGATLDALRHAVAQSPDTGR